MLLPKGMILLRETEIFHSRDSRYKTPYGAVASNTEVHLNLRPSREMGFSRGEVTLRYEMDGNRTETIPMPWTDTDWTEDVFSCTVHVGNYVGLVWYQLRLFGFEGRYWESEEHQLTVYDASEPVPNWFGKGMCYQILPDRFYRTRIPNPEGMVGGRWVHENWEDIPVAGSVGKTPDGKDICNRDFFGGNLAGIEEKLPYLASLGVETIYFCPIFEAAENHRYGTADYRNIDPMLGTEEDFVRLCDKAHALGMRVLLDGVFNHTGYVSRYFNGDGFYTDEPGALQSQDSPYYHWFEFSNWPKEYNSWWGIYSLPEVNEGDPGYRSFIFDSEDSVVRHWLRLGADGWRLDVADELPDDFIRGLHAAVRAEQPDGTVIGEVWEDGTTKIAYGVRRHHLLGRHLDGLMDYPFRNALIDYLMGGDAAEFQETMETLRENYPPFAFYSAMNALGTHDTVRILTQLGTGGDHRSDWPRWKREAYTLTPEERNRGVALLRIGAAVLFQFPGAPTVYYGDEVGMEGFEDPYNRRTFPWGNEDTQIRDWFTTLGQNRKHSKALREGGLRWGTCEGHVLSFVRDWGGELQGLAVNCGTEPALVELPWDGMGAVELDQERSHLAVDGVLCVNVPPMGVIRLKDTPATNR